jgi:cell division protein FtsZ
MEFVSDFVSETDNAAIIKVIGVGGGGCNAINRMVDTGLQGVTFIAVNTDRQALSKCKAEVKIQLGEKIAGGRGAGANPEIGQKAAEETIDEIIGHIQDADMVFITAGMGGGTGTGAAPVIASMAKKKDILTVGVVTIPFKNQGNETMSKALDGISELEKNVDSLLIINNEKLFDVYGDLLLQDAFPKADEVLATAVRGITEIIQKKGYINVDFKDVKTMMKDSGYALMGCGTGTGDNRIEEAVKMALESPLLNDFDMKSAANVLINVTVGENDKGMTMAEYAKLNELITGYTGKANSFKSGIVFDNDPQFGDRVNITVIVTGINTIMAQPQVDLGNVIIVDNDFTYKKHERVGGEIELPEIKVQEIGYNSAVLRKKHLFEDGKKPAMILNEGDSKSELESTPAIRRKAHNPSKKEE